MRLLLSGLMIILGSCAMAQGTSAENWKTSARSNTKNQRTNTAKYMFPSLVRISKVLKEKK